MANIKDFATALIATAPSPANSGTSLVLQAGKGARMPAVPFAATIHPEGEIPTLDNAEKVNVTNVVADTLTIQRAQGETTAKNIGIGWRISNAIFASDLDLSGLVPKTTAVNTLYGVNGSGNQASYLISQGSDTSSIAQRSSGGTLTVGTPTASAHATTKAYVDAADTAHTSNTSNPHSVTKAQVGLGNADNTSDADKPVSTAQQTALDGKQNADATLTALAAHNTNGILTQTAADTFTGRTITGTANQVNVTNGDGVSGNPTLSLPQDIHTGATPQFNGLAIVSTVAEVSLTSQSADDWSSGLHVRKRGTTGDANAAVVNGAEAGYHTFGGWDGTTYKRLAYVITRANGAITPTTGGGVYKINVRSADGVEGDRLSLDSVAMSLAVNSNPISNSTYTLGTSSLYWKEAYANKLFLNSTATLDGSTAGEIKGTGIFTADNIKRGTGFPEGVVTANVGSIYIDTAITNGASSWIKKSGTGSTGWQVLEGDTGWRQVATSTGTGSFLVRRTNAMVFFILLFTNSATVSNGMVVGTIAAGFTPYLQLNGTYGESGSTPTKLMTFKVAGDIELWSSPTASAVVRADSQWPTSAAWPTTLPGVSA